MWADGIYLGAGLEKESSCLLTIVGARADGTKGLLATTRRQRCWNHYAEVRIMPMSPALGTRLAA